MWNECEGTTIQLYDSQNSDTFAQREDLNSDNQSLTDYIQTDPNFAKSQDNYRMNSRDDTELYYASVNLDYYDEAKSGPSENHEEKYGKDFLAEMSDGNLRNVTSKSERKHHHRKHRKHGKKKRKRVFVAAVDEKAKVKVSLKLFE